VIIVSHLLDDIGWWPLVGGSKIINTLHGVATIKDTTGDVQGRAANLLQNDYLVSTSEYHDSLLQQRSWTRNKDVSLITGYPRDDILFHDIAGHDLIDGEYYERIKQISEQNTVISYHPTHRNTSPNPLLDNNNNLEDMNDFLRERDAYLLIKPHPSQQSADHVEDYDRIESIPPSIDMYPVMRNIDILVTDYSSIYYDFLLTGKSPVLFPYDLEEYREQVGIHPDIAYQKLGDTATSYEELKEVFEEYIATGGLSLTEDQEIIRNRTFAFIDGDSSKRVYEQIQSELLDR
jgi:CDP-glycerol glycerophosphotransferase